MRYTNKKLFAVANIIFVSILGPVFSWASASAVSYTTSLTTSGDINLDVSIGSNAASVATDNLTIVSTCPSGYNLSISGPNDTTLYKDGDNTSSSKIVPSTGTLAEPATILDSNRGTWGYSTISSSVTGTFTGLTSERTIISTSSTATPSTGTTLPVYYGVSITDNFTPGTYKMAESSTGAGDNAITYYLTTPLECMSYKVEFNPTSYIDDVPITGTGVMDEQSILENQYTTLRSNSFIAPEGYYFYGWNTAMDGSGTHYIDQQEVFNLVDAGETIVLYAMWTDCPPGNICYRGNGADNSDIPYVDSTTNFLDEQDIQLQATPFRRHGYGFAGWSIDKTVEAAPMAPIFGPNETVNFMEEFQNPLLIEDLQNAHGLDLYAVWVESAGELQNWTGCSDLFTGSVTALTDTRDDNVYAVAKLADGNCWMIENLRLENTAAHNTDGTLAQGYGQYFQGLANPENSEFRASTARNSLYYYDSYPYGPAVKDEYSFPHYNNSNTSNPHGQYIYGNYYTWNAAIADTTKYGSSYRASTSICPKSWRLPNGGGDSDFLNLGFRIAGQPESVQNPNDGIMEYRYENDSGKLASNAFRSYPYNFVYSGYYESNTSLLLDSLGTYWTNTSTDQQYTGSSYAFSFDNDTVIPGGKTYTLRAHGYTIRCLIDN